MKNRTFVIILTSFLLALSSAVLLPSYPEAGSGIQLLYFASFHFFIALGFGWQAKERWLFALLILPASLWAGVWQMIRDDSLQSLQVAMYLVVTPAGTLLGSYVGSRLRERVEHAGKRRDDARPSLIRFCLASGFFAILGRALTDGVPLVLPPQSRLSPGPLLAGPYFLLALLALALVPMILNTSRLPAGSRQALTATTMIAQCLFIILLSIQIALIVCVPIV